MPQCLAATDDADQYVVDIATNCCRCNQQHSGRKREHERFGSVINNTNEQYECEYGGKCASCVDHGQSDESAVDRRHDSHGRDRAVADGREHHINSRNCSNHNHRDPREQRKIDRSGNNASSSNDANNANNANDAVDAVNTNKYAVRNHYKYKCRNHHKYKCRNLRTDNSSDRER